MDVRIPLFPIVGSIFWHYIFIVLYSLLKKKKTENQKYN